MMKERVIANVKSAEKDKSGQACQGEKTSDKLEETFWTNSLSVNKETVNHCYWKKKNLNHAENSRLRIRLWKR